jgi:hypothetical protein
MRRVALALAAAALLSTLPSPVEAQSMRLGEVMVFYLPEIRQGADTKALVSHLNGHVLPMWNKATPGIVARLVHKDRGNRTGEYMVVWTTDTLARHKAYASASGDFPFAADITAKAGGDFRPTLAPYVTGGKFIEYHLVAPQALKMPLPEVNVLGLHYALVRPDRREAFDKFVADKLHPAVGNLQPDLRLLYYRPVRGEQPGAYVTNFALTEGSRDKYWPKGADSDVLRTTFSPAIKALAEELRGYLVEGSYNGNPKLAAAVYEGKEWADWVVVR